MSLNDADYLVEKRMKLGGGFTIYNTTKYNAGYDYPQHF